jgi:hypothetical protein
MTGSWNMLDLVGLLYESICIVFYEEIPSYPPAKCPALAGTKKEPNSRNQSNRTGFEIQDKNIRLCYEKPGRFFIADDNLSRVFLPAAGYR